MPEVVTHHAHPEEYSAMGVRRYGYHGISYESIALPVAAQCAGKLIVAHLGNGASILRHPQRKVAWTPQWA